MLFKEGDIVYYLSGNSGSYTVKSSIVIKAYWGKIEDVLGYIPFYIIDCETDKYSDHTLYRSSAEAIESAKILNDWYWRDEISRLESNPQKSKEK